MLHQVLFTGYVEYNFCKVPVTIVDFFTGNDFLELSVFSYDTFSRFVVIGGISEISSI